MMGSQGTRSVLHQVLLALQPQIHSIRHGLLQQSGLSALRAAAACATLSHIKKSSSSGSSSNAGNTQATSAGAFGASVLLVGAAVSAGGVQDGAAGAEMGQNRHHHLQQQQQQQQRQQHTQQHPQNQPQQQQQEEQKQQQQRPWQLLLLTSSLQRFTAAADAAAQQQQQQQRPAAWASAAGPAGPGGQASEPLSGAIPLLDEDGLTNHPLDYNPITNEHTAAMTLAKQAGVEAYQAGRYAEAERRFKEALVEARAGFPPDDPHIPSSLHYLAEFYRNVGQLDKAEPLYRETITQLGDTLGERHWMFSAALCSLAALHQARGEYNQAIELLEAALELRRQLFGSSSFLYADTSALLAKTLMQQHTAAALPAAAAPAAGSSGGGLLSRLLGGSSSSSRSSSTAAADVLRAISLWQQSIHVVEDSGSVAHSPIVVWLLDLAEAQQTAAQPTAAVATLQKAISYMALSQEDSSSSSTQTYVQQQQQQMGDASIPPASSSSSSSSSVDTAGDDALTAALAASGGDVELARRQLSAMASEVAERLVDAQLAAGDLQGARSTLRRALEARIALLGRHLVVAKTMTRLANLLMQPPLDPLAPQLAPQFAANAVSIADTALQTAQRASLWRGIVRGALKAVQTASLGGYKAGLEAERTCDRLLAALQLGQASLALAAAEKMNGRLSEAESALRHGVTELRWVLGVGGTDLERLSSSTLESALLQRVGGLLVDLKLVQMDCLEALATLLREQPAATAAAAPAAAAGGGGRVGPGEEVARLLGEADQLAAELCAE